MKIKLNGEQLTGESVQKMFDELTKKYQCKTLFGLQCRLQKEQHRLTAKI